MLGHKLIGCMVGDNNVICHLNSLGINTIKVNNCTHLQHPVSNHADMLFYQINSKKILAYYKCYEEMSYLTNMGFEVQISHTKLQKDYPYDVQFNVARVSNFIICNEKHSHPNILTSGIILNSNQGYSKCSTLIVDSNSIITADISIYNIAIKNHIDALLISHGNIILKGYDYGFIGGCGVKIDSNTIYFTGNILSHPDSSIIIEFLNARNVNFICGVYPQLVDVGLLGLFQMKI